ECVERSYCTPCWNSWFGKTPESILSQKEYLRFSGNTENWVFLQDLIINSIYHMDSNIYAGKFCLTWTFRPSTNAKKTGKLYFFKNCMDFFGERVHPIRNAYKFQTGSNEAGWRVRWRNVHF
ncbi:MAG: hypothetical protein H7833_09125, partial [Magnetococcus sp. DMHC-1]